MGEEWRGGNMKIHPGGGQKVNIYKQNLVEYKDNSDLIIIMTDRSVI